MGPCLPERKEFGVRCRGHWRAFGRCDLLGVPERDLLPPGTFRGVTDSDLGWWVGPG